jgi:hypothetical protein
MTPCSNLVAGVAVANTEFERAKKRAIVGEVRPDESRRSLITRPDLARPMGELAQYRAATHEINISGNQLLVALAAGFSLAGPLLWAFVRYWLFAP